MPSMSTLVSYAQNFEDIMLWRALSHVRIGAYIDVGAQSPDTDSVSRLFYDQGWRGVHVEPTHAYANALRDRRPDEVVMQVAMAASPGIRRFFDIPGSGLSTMDEAIAGEHQAAGFEVKPVQVPFVTLDTVLEQLADRDVHWLKIDVEGAEADVLAGWETSSVRPWIVVIESTRPLSPEQTHQQWEPRVLSKGYRFAYFDGLNRFYVSDAHPELLAAFDRGPNVFDNFALSAGSVFCAEVNLSYRALQVHTDRLIDERDALVAAQEAELRELRPLQEEVGSLRELSAELERVKPMLDELAQLRERDGELERLQSKNAVVEAELERAVMEHAVAINAMVQAQHRSLNEHARMLEQATGQSEAELQTTRAELADQREESHRWWREAERLRAMVTKMEGSRSWQLTRPLRAVRQRMSGGVLVSAKRGLRPLVTMGLKAAFTMPRLRRALRPLVVRIPFLYDRLFVMAYDRGMFDALQAHGQQAGGVRNQENLNIHLDSRARKVLADLRIACRQGEGL